MCIDEGGSESVVNIESESLKRSGLIDRNEEGAWQVSLEDSRRKRQWDCRKGVEIDSES